jgi:hypothetical protein
LLRILVGASSLAPSAAHAELKPIFDQLRLYNSPVTLPTIEVEAEGQDCTGRFPGGGKRRWGEFSFELPKTYLNSAVLACNQNKQSGANTDGTHTTYVRLGFKLFVGAARVGNPATKLVDGDVQAKVVCKKAPKFVEISHFAVKVDNSTDKCPKQAVVQVGFSTNRDDRIDFTLEHMNSELQTSEHFVQPFQIGRQYTATKLIDLVVDSNTKYVEVRLKDGSDSKRWRPSGPLGIPCPRAFKVTSLWLTYDVEDKDTCPKKVREKGTGKATAPGQAPFEIKAQSPGRGFGHGGLQARGHGVCREVRARQARLERVRVRHDGAHQEPGRRQFWLGQAQGGLPGGTLGQADPEQPGRHRTSLTRWSIR